MEQLYREWQQRQVYCICSVKSVLTLSVNDSQINVIFSMCAFMRYGSGGALSIYTGGVCRGTSKRGVLGTGTSQKGGY